MLMHLHNPAFHAATPASSAHGLVLGPHPSPLCLPAARKEMGMLDPKHKKLPADALRTLESIYTRTPFPSKDVIR